MKKTSAKPPRPLRGQAFMRAAVDVSEQNNRGHAELILIENGNMG